MKKLLGLLLLVLLSGCGYHWQGFQTAATGSALGQGEKTLRITQVEQATLYPWLPYYMRSQLRDEVNLRKIGIFMDEGPVDYNLEIRVPLFQVRSVNADAEDVTLISSADVQLELLAYNSVTGTLAWRSGMVNYSEQYENLREDSAIREVITQAMRRALDRLQQNF